MLNQTQLLQQILCTLKCNHDNSSANNGNVNNDKQTALLAEIKQAIENNTSVLKAELDEMQTAVTDTIQEVIASIDDGIEVTATQKGKWQVEVTNPTDLDELAGKITKALENLNVTIAGQKADLNVNITNDKLTVTVDNFPQPQNYTDSLTSIIAKLEKLQQTIKQQNQVVWSGKYTSKETISDKKHIVITVRKGKVKIFVNGEPHFVEYGKDNGDDVHIYRTEPIYGTVTIEPISGYVEYIVEHGGDL